MKREEVEMSYCVIEGSWRMSDQLPDIGNITEEELYRQGYKEKTLNGRRGI